VTGCVGCSATFSAGKGRDGSSPRRSACHFYSPARSRKAADSAELSDLCFHSKPIPVSAGIKRRARGQRAMAVLACLYGLLKQGSIWYPINLLAATGYAQSLRIGTASLDAFHLAFSSWRSRSSVHSLLVGLLYGAMLPEFPRRPFFWSVIAPILWTEYSAASWAHKSTARSANDCGGSSLPQFGIRHRCGISCGAQSVYAYASLILFVMRAV